MYGDGLSVELQYLLALEFLALAEGIEVKECREAYFEALRRKFKTSKLPAFQHGLPIEEVIEILKEARNEVDPSKWIDITDELDS
jgi:hypothetical protein